MMKRNIQRIAFLIAAIAIFAVPMVRAEGWGSLKGTFVIEGTAPEQKAIASAASNPDCKTHKVFDHSVVVGKTGGVANVVIYLMPKRGTDVPVHSDYNATEKSEVVLDNKNCEFVPHVTLIRTTQSLVIKNSDAFGHNTKCELGKNTSFNEIIPAAGSVTKSLNKEEAVPVSVNCNIHTFMQGHLLVRETPYMVASAEDGTFEIKNLPEGEHEFVVWHEVPGNLKSLKLGQEKTNARGRVKFTIKDGDTLDLGTVKIPASLLQAK